MKYSYLETRSRCVNTSFIIFVMTLFPGWATCPRVESRAFRSWSSSTTPSTETSPTRRTRTSPTIPAGCWPAASTTTPTLSSPAFSTPTRSTRSCRRGLRASSPAVADSAAFRCHCYKAFLMLHPNKLEFFSLTSLSVLVYCNTLAYWAYSWVKKKM